MTEASRQSRYLNSTPAARRPLTMGDDEKIRRRLYHRGCGIKAAISGLGVSISEIAIELNISQSQFSKILRTYCHLKISECEETIVRAEKVLERRGATFLHSDDKVGILLDCENLKIITK